MPVIVQNGITITVDEDGFLADPEQWSEPVAGVLASREGVEDLSPGDIDILKFLRSYHRKHAFFPILRAVCRAVRQSPNCVADRFSDPVTAWKVAGLPNPGEEVIGFRSWEPLGY